MSSSDIVKKVASAKRYTKLVECYRTTLEDRDIYDLGYVVDATDDFVMLHLVDDRITLNGYSLLRISDITEIETEVEHTRFIEKALEIRKKTVKQPVLVDLTDIRTIINSINQNFNKFLNLFCSIFCSKICSKFCSKFFSKNILEKYLGAYF